MIILGLTGMAGSGKDTVADTLVQYHGYTRLAFADPLRAMALSLNPIISCHTAIHRLSDAVEVYGWDVAKREYPEVRRILQRVGTDMIRNHVSDTFWVDKAMDTILAASEDARWVVTDCRFPNEAEVIDQAGWVILVERPGLEPLPGAHVSEAGVPDNLISFDLLNDSTIEKLAEKTGCLAEYIQREYASTEAL